MSDSIENTNSLSHYVLICTVLMLCCLLVIRIFKGLHIKAIPESTAVIITGVTISLFLVLTESAVHHGMTTRIHLIFDGFPREVFFHVLLPPIIFYSGYSLKKRHFFKNIGAISMLAIVSTCGCAVIFGYALYFFAGFPLLESLTFGSLISATDPVAVISQYTELGVSNTLFGICAGESVMNDAVAIVLFDTMAHLMHMRDINMDITVLDAVYHFVIITVGSVTLGFGIGIITSYLLKFLSLDHKWDTAMLLVTAYLSYITGDVLPVSGIVAVFFTGIADSHYTYHVLSSPEAQDFSMWFFDLLSNICEIFVFLFLGLSIEPYTASFDFKLISISFVAIVVARFLMTFSLLSIVNTSREHKVSSKQMVAISWGGLRGAIAFALALVYPIPELRELVTSTTIAIVVLTVFIFGSTNVALLNALGGMFGDGDRLELPDDQLVKRSGVLKFDAQCILPFISVRREDRMRRISASSSPVQSPAIKKDREYLALDAEQ